MDKEQLKYLLRAQHENTLPKLIPRKPSIPYAAGKIVSLIGMRRVGKTFLLFERMQELLGSGVDRRQLIYINFEDDRIAPVAADEFSLVTRAHEELYPDLIDKPRFFFFDEIQSAPGWERYCRRLYDTDRPEIVVTGSSSHFLAREVATTLRGRSLPIEVFPLSFREFLSFRKFEADPYSKRSESRLVAELEAYLRIGGLPEVVLAEEAVRPLILREYGDLILYKDLIDRHKLSNPIAIKQLIRHCLSSPASLVNVSKLFNDFKSRGVKLGKDLLYRYLEILQESFIIYLLPVAERSLRKRAINPKKLHLIDWAIGYNYVPEELIDRGRKLENAIFLHERRKNLELGYLHSPSEIDLVDSVEHPRRLINVCWSLNDPTTRAREFRALENVKAKEKILVVHGETPKLRPPAGVEVVNAFRYLCEE